MVARGDAIDRASDLRFIGRGFESCLGTIAQWRCLDKLLTPVCLSPSSVTWYRSNGGDGMAAGKVIIGLATHWPCVTDFVVYLPTGSRPM